MSTQTPILPPAAPALVDAKGLLERLFDDKSRPSVQWIRSLQRRGEIPFLKCGRLVRFDVDQVRAVFQKSAVDGMDKSTGGSHEQ